MTTKEKAEVMLAADRGEKIRYRIHHTDEWYDVICQPTWNWSHYEYKAVPPKMEVWCNIYPEHVRAFHDSKKQADFAAGPNRVRCVHLREVE